MTFPQALHLAISWLWLIKHKSKRFQIAGFRLVSKTITTSSLHAILIVEV
ncbi:hypothetical protein Hanom_Chr10g00943631 [Helianthus anomalus]